MFLASDNDVPDILVVDDTPADCHCMAAVLTAQGYRVRTAHSGYRALEEIDTAAPDLILLGINMPECTSLLQERRELPADKRGRRSAGRTLLLVDAGPQSGPSIDDVPASSGYRVLHANDVNAAFNILAAEDVGVIICGQRLAGIGGIEFLSRVSRMYPSTVRIMRSDGDDAGLVADAINLGNVYRFVQKTCKGDDLAAMLDAAFVWHENEAGLKKTA